MISSEALPQTDSPVRVDEIPNANVQTPKKLQDTTCSSERAQMCIGDLGFLWRLEIWRLKVFLPMIPET
jgi:hypothetical protein